MTFFKRNISEIFNDSKLSLYGMLLSVSHILTAYYFYPARTDLNGIICWQFFPNCTSVSGLILKYLNQSLFFYGFLSISCGLLFLMKKREPAYYLFLGLSFFKLIVHLSDYRFMGNYHYMSHVVNFTFLFLFNKRNMLKLFLVLFYVSAGLIKFNTDWFSGQALINPTFFSGYLLILACTYVVILEMIFSWLLLAKDRRLFWFALFQVCLFHIFSWHIVGYFYPAIMFLLISLFFIQREVFQFPKEAFNRCIIVLFMIAQVVPFTIDKNSSLTNHYRVYSLNMLDAYSVCESRFFIKKIAVTIEYKPNLSQFAIRVHCDPIVLLSLLTKTCLDQASSEEFIDIDVDHQVRRKSDFSIIHQQNFVNACTNKLKIDRLSGGLYQ